MTEKTLGEALPKKMKEIREEFIPAYQSIGPSGQFAITVFNDALTRAEKAMSESDTIEMMRSYEELKGFKL